MNGIPGNRFYHAESRGKGVSITLFFVTKLNTSNGTAMEASK